MKQERSRKTLKFVKGLMEFETNRFPLDEHKEGIFTIYDHHQVILIDEGRGEVSVNIGYKKAREDLIDRLSTVAKKLRKKVDGAKIVGVSRLHGRLETKLVLDTKVDPHTINIADSTIPSEIAKRVIREIKKELGSSIKIESQLEDRRVNPFWIENGIRNFLKLEDYLKALKECVDEPLDGVLGHPFEWKLGLYDNWRILVNCRVIQIAEFFEKVGYDKNSDYSDDGKHFVQKIAEGAVYFDVQELNGKRFDLPYNSIVNIYPRTAGKITDRAAGWKAQAHIIGETGNFILENDLEAYLPKTRPTPTFNKIPKDPNKILDRIRERGII